MLVGAKHHPGWRNVLLDAAAHHAGWRRILCWLEQRITLVGVMYYWMAQRITLVGAAHHAGWRRISCFLVPNIVGLRSASRWLGHSAVFAGVKYATAAQMSTAVCIHKTITAQTSKGSKRKTAALCVLFQLPECVATSHLTSCDPTFSLKFH